MSIYGPKWAPKGWDSLDSMHEAMVSIWEFGEIYAETHDTMREVRDDALSLLV